LGDSKAERCTEFAQKLCEHAGKLVMPQATCRQACL